MKVYRRSRGANSFLDLTIGQVSEYFKHWQLYTSGEDPQYPTNWKMFGPQSWTRHFGEDRNSCPARNQNPDRPACTLVTTISMPTPFPI